MFNTESDIKRMLWDKSAEDDDKERRSRIRLEINVHRWQFHRRWFAQVMIIIEQENRENLYVHVVIVGHVDCRLTIDGFVAVGHVQKFVFVRLEFHWCNETLSSMGCETYMFFIERSHSHRSVGNRLERMKHAFQSSSIDGWVGACLHCWQRRKGHLQVVVGFVFEWESRIGPPTHVNDE